MSSSGLTFHRLFIKRAIKNELFYYEHPEMTPNYIKLIWKLEQYIQNQEEVNFYYNNREEMKIEIISGVPMAVYFDNFYFYISVIVNKRFKIFNINWINNLKSTGKFISYDYSSRFLPGKHRNLSYYNYLGNVTKIRFEYYGLIDYVKDRFPTCRIMEIMDKENPIEQEKLLGKPVYLIEIEVEYSIGIEMWLLSNIYESKVHSPTFVVNRLKNILRQSLNWYE